ncbi:MAG: type I restriction endonuclease, partial [Clostridia bacterium]|nr:type I restriction endonuclease [Clostridia bacterium]
MDTKKLRQKILDLAIRGKLVPQDPNDEPASVLLERIRTEKERLIAEGKIKRPKKSKASSSESHYQQLFQLPHNWEWIELGEFTYDLQYGTSERSLSKGDVSVLRMGNLTRIGTIDYSNLVYTCNQADIEKYELQEGDLLFNRTNSSEWVGKTSLYDGKIPAIYAGYLIKIRTIAIDSKFLCMYMCSKYYRDWCLQVKTDAVNQSNINAQKLSKLYCPIPPLKEQRRIVSAFNNMIAILSQIEFSKSILLSTITYTKSKILELAMQGKLVPQDLTDEHAAEMLKRINPKAKIITDNPHYPKLPDNWAYISIDDVNSYESKSINPSVMPNNIFELYSVPVFSIGNPEKVLGKEIGSTKQKVEKGDVLLCKINPHLNRVWEIEKNSINMQIASSEWIVIRSREIEPTYLKFYFESPHFRELLCSQVSGVGGSLTRAQ